MDYYVLKQVIQVKNSLCLSRYYVGAWERANDVQYDIQGETWYGHGELRYWLLCLEEIKHSEDINRAFKTSILIMEQR